jgi:CspA family cold shock protein
MSSPRYPRQQILSEGVTATVKWFNSEKGFGFASPTDGGADLFLHISALSSTGMDSLPEGATITCDVGQGQRGPQIVAVHSVDSSTAAPRSDRRGPGGPGGGGMRSPYGRPEGGRQERGGYGDRGGDRGGYQQDRGYDREPRYDRGGGGYDAAPSSGEVRNGTVKFFDTARGFGFISPVDGGRDIFLHATSLTRAGLPFPDAGQQVQFTTREGKKGEEVADIAYI